MQNKNINSIEINREKREGKSKKALGNNDEVIKNELISMMDGHFITLSVKINELKDRLEDVERQQKAQHELVTYLRIAIEETQRLINKQKYKPKNKNYNKMEVHK